LKNDNEDLFPKSDDVDKQVDDLFSETPMELKKVTENFRFLNKIEKNPVEKNKFWVNVFGADKVDLNSILMMNLFDRSILVTDAVNKLVVRMTLEQLKKYVPKKTKKGFEYWWLILLLIIGGLAVAFVIIFLLPKLMNIKIF
jgi:hypothetical protein